MGLVNSEASPPSPPASRRGAGDGGADVGVTSAASLLRFRTQYSCAHGNSAQVAAQQQRLAPGTGGGGSGRSAPALPGHPQGLIEVRACAVVTKQGDRVCRVAWMLLVRGGRLAVVAHAAKRQQHACTVPATLTRPLFSLLAVCRGSGFRRRGGALHGGN